MIERVERKMQRNRLASISILAYRVIESSGCIYWCRLTSDPLIPLYRSTSLIPRSARYV